MVGSNYIDIGRCNILNWWVSTDWHKNHTNILQYEGRPENHSELLVERHNEVMDRKDGLICLGDVIFGINKAENLYDYLKLFRCKKIVLVRGNHDKKPDEWYIDLGFDMVCDQLTMRGILFSHAPATLSVDHALNVHGHLHSNTHRDPELFWYHRDDRHILLSVELTDYYPISLGDLKNGRYTVDNTVYFRKGCTNGLQARNEYSAEGRGPKG